MSTPTIDYDAIAKKYGATSSAAPQSSPAPQGASASVDYDAIAQKYGATSSQPAAPAEQPGLIDRAGNFLQKVHEQGPVELGKGLLKGAGDTVVGSLDILQKAQPTYALSKMGFKPAQEEQAQWDQNTAEARKMLEAKNEGQEFGKGVEFIGEMMLGDAAFKGLTALEKVKQLHKVAQMVERFPIISKILQRSVQTGLSTATVEGVKTGDAEKAVEAGAAGALFGAAGEGAIAGVKAGAKALKGTPKVVGSLVDSVTGKGAQKELQAGIRSAATETAKEAGVDAAETSIRNTVRETSKSVKGKADKLYAEIDRVTDNRFSNIENALRDSKKALRNIKGADDVAEERITAKIATLENDMKEVVAMAEREGVDPSVAEAARATYKQAMALKDVDKTLQAVTEGDASVGTVETVKPAVLANQLQALYSKGRLQEAFGETQAKKILRSALDAKDAVRSHAKNLKRVRNVGIATGALGGVGVIGKLGLDALGGE
jgi:hypothetical protein